MIEISTFIKKWNVEYGQYPETLESISTNRPHRKLWLKDAWDNSYYYSLKKNDFILISKGIDGILNTSDDIKAVVK